MAMANSFNQVCSRVALARVRAGAKREPGRAKHEKNERGLKPRDYILDCGVASKSTWIDIIRVGATIRCHACFSGEFQDHISRLEAVGSEDRFSFARDLAPPFDQ